MTDRLTESNYLTDLAHRIKIERRDGMTNVYGIVRYAPGTGATPKQHDAVFDGWYFDLAYAEAIFADWRKRYPQWVVALATSQGDEIRWRRSRPEMPADASSESCG